jgi:CDP-diacylglycerol--serine O-phosphatidyltransferase
VALKQTSRRRLRTIAVLPTLFTLGNLVCGFFSIVVASRVERPLSAQIPISPEFQMTGPAGVIHSFDPNDPTHNIMLSGWLIFLAMVFDALDGHVARLARTCSEFGAELDSLCDVVSFGVAPGFLLVKMCPYLAYSYPEAIWVIAALLPVCAALRLARFNVETPEDDDHSKFSGLPSPAAAGSIASFAILFYTLRLETNPPADLHQIDSIMEIWVCAFALTVGALMVSRIPYPHLVNQIVRGQRSFAHIVSVVFALVAIMVIKGYSIPIICTIFVLVPPAKFFWQRLQHRSTETEPMF